MFIEVAQGIRHISVCLSVQKDSVLFMVFLGLGILMCAVNRLFLNAEKFLVSRDWVVVISDDDTLSSLNAILTSLDQLANVISPIITGVNAFPFQYLEHGDIKA
ncbi:unnamed protein product [Strongylus vulgaris]|uniref:Solute carrier family 40 member n=1 Tax=Strongylus vulgaris TaxID=40348 RepID=A0A3P7K986_STRVU|nr:unnamed protein product [Strongylus vulgaris]